MKAIEFEGQNLVIAKDQPQYNPLPAHVGQKPEHPVTSCWELNEEELRRVLRTGKIWITQLSFGQPLQPIRVSTVKPEIASQPSEQP